jgi:cAMP-dependent protein kinase regulator
MKELSAAVQADPGSVARRLELAAVLRDLGRLAEAVELYRGVALLYADEGRYAQAIAVCRGILEIDPGHRETAALLAKIASKRPSRERRVAWASADFAEAPEHATPLPPPLPRRGMPTGRRPTPGAAAR